MSDSRGRIGEAFAAARAQGRAALVTYLTAWDGGREHSLACLQAAASAGADILEVGVPFSDPMADGPVIQGAMTRALAAGATLTGVLELCGQLRGLTPTPTVLFGYANPILAMGAEVFARACADQGVAGVLVVDLPPESAGWLREPLDAVGVDWIGLVAPTSTAARREAVLAVSSGFIYAITQRGVTGGAGPGDRAALTEQVGLLRAGTSLPIAAGFGVRAPEHVQALAPLVDGVVVGSALVTAANEGVEPLAQQVAALRAATGKPGPRS